MKTNKDLRYVVILMSWGNPVKLGWRDAESMKKLVSVVKKIPIKGYELSWSGSGPVEPSGLVSQFSNFFLEFKTKSAWQKAVKVIDQDDRFEFRDVKSNNPKMKWYRNYKWVDRVKAGVGK